MLIWRIKRKNRTAEYICLIIMKSNNEIHSCHFGTPPDGHFLTLFVFRWFLSNYWPEIECSIDYSFIHKQLLFTINNYFCSQLTVQYNIHQSRGYAVQRDYSCAGWSPVDRPCPDRCSEVHPRHASPGTGSLTWDYWNISTRSRDIPRGWGDGGGKVWRRWEGGGGKVEWEMEVRRLRDDLSTVFWGLISKDIYSSVFGINKQRYI